MKYQNQIAVRSLAIKQGRFSERLFAKESGISRASLRNLLARNQNITLSSLVKVAVSLEREIQVLATCTDTNTEMSTLAVGYKVMSQGFNSWKIYFMNFVDEFRRTLDPQLLLLPPPRELDAQLKALLASIVVQLCSENCIDPPPWSGKINYLDKPWFVSGMESLKAMALLESPLAFRRNNIFVLENFLERV